MKRQVFPSLILNSYLWSVRFFPPLNRFVLACYAFPFFFSVCRLKLSRPQIKNAQFKLRPPSLYSLVWSPTKLGNIISSWQISVNVKRFRLSPYFFFYSFHFCHVKNWMAYEKYPSTWKGKESKSILFSAKELPSAQNKYALCKVCIYYVYDLLWAYGWVYSYLKIW